MSIKTLRKRIALVATVSLGFGLLSVVPASATLTNLTGVSLAKVNSPTDTSIVVLNTGSFGGVVQQAGVTIYTDKTYVLPADLQATITSTDANTATYGIIFSPDLVTGTGTITNSALVTVSAATASFTDVIPNDLGAKDTNATYATYTDDLNADSTATDSALYLGTHYMYVTLAVNATARASTTWVVKIIIANPTMSAVETVIANSSTTLAGRTSQQVSIPITSTNALLSAGSGARPFMRFAASITSQPSGSLVYPTLTAGSATLNTTFTRFDATKSVSSGSTLEISASVARTSEGNAQGVASILYTTTEASGAEAAAVTTAQTVGTLTFTPTVVGTYSITVWGERDSSTGGASLSGSESAKTFTVNVSTGVATIAMTAINSTSSTAAASFGSLVKVTLKDAAGNATTLAPGESVAVTPSGSAIIAKVNNATASSTAAQTWNLSAANFNTSGVAWINVTDTVAESATITASISGGTSASTTLTFVATVEAAVAPYLSSLATGADVVSGTSMKIPLGASSLTYRAAASTGSSVMFSVLESLNSSVGSITGYTTALSYSGVGAGDTTLLYASFGVTATTTVAGQSYRISSTADNNSNPSTTTSEATTSGVLAVTPATVNAVAGATNSFTALLKDKFKRAYASQTVSVTVAGKNPTAAAATLVTDATGRATYSLTDANTNTAVTDTVTFTAGSAAAVSVSYGTNAASTVTVASDNYTVTGVANDAVTPKAIATGYKGAQAGARTVTATVKNAAGALLAGVPVVFTVSGTTAAVTSTTATVYTSVSGTASASVYGWATGTYTVTATTGGKSGTATVTFYSTGDDSVRTVSATASGNQVTGMAKDRFGNAVQGATLYAKITAGTGNIGGAITTAGALTDSNGKVVWVVSDATSTVTVSNIPFSAVAGTIAGQTSAAVGYDIGGADATAMTAATTGTTTTAETGVGSSFAAAGVSSASVEATVANDASAAADAAAEATDAANAATDAANAAAEAADAATAAAQDAADAVAALSAQVATLVASIKAQITALTALIVKIQKKVKA